MTDRLHLFAAEDFPITIRARRADTDEVVWEATLEAPAEGLNGVYVPPLRKIHGAPIITEVQLAGGEIHMDVSE